MIFFTFLDFFSREKKNTILFHQFMIVWSDTKTNEDLKMFQPNVPNNGSGSVTDLQLCTLLYPSPPQGDVLLLILNKRLFKYFVDLLRFPTALVTADKFAYTELSYLESLLIKVSIGLK